MKQFTLALLATLSIWIIMPNQSTAQTFAVGDKVFNLGIGFGGRTGDLGFGNIGISGSLEVGMWETGDFGVIGIGGFAGFRSGKYGFGNSVKYNSFVVAPRGTFHFTAINVENLDVYAALQIDISFNSVKIEGFESSSATDIEPALIAAARYYLAENLGVFAELGVNGLSVLTLGGSLRF